MATDAAERLAARYGTSRGPMSARRWWILGGIAVLLGVAALAFVALRLPSSSIDYRTIRYDIVDDHTTTVTLEVSTTAGAGARCALEALNESYTPIGWTYVDIPAAASAETRTLTFEIRTLTRPVAASANQCWVPRG